MSPGGVRIGTPALTTRGFKEKVNYFLPYECTSGTSQQYSSKFCIVLCFEDFIQVGEFLHQAIELCVEIQKQMQTKKLAEFKELLRDNEKVNTLADKVENFSKKYYFPGRMLQ